MVRRVCSVAIVVAIVLGPLTPPLRGPECHQCPPGCPMHAHHLGCHHAHATPSAADAAAGMLSCACGHADTRASAPAAWQGLPPAPAQLAVAVLTEPWRQNSRRVRPVPAPEPPLRPPRLLAVA